MKKFIVFLLGVLGFSACGNNDGDGWDSPVMYGTPSVDYTINGKVTNEAGNPIKGIQVASGDDISGDPFNLQSAEDGSFVLEREDDAAVFGTIILTDIDGQDNGGLYKEKRVKIQSLPMKKLKDGDGKWYQGAYEITADIQLEEDK